MERHNQYDHESNALADPSFEQFATKTTMSPDARWREMRISSSRYPYAIAVLNPVSLCGHPNYHQVSEASLQLVRRPESESKVGDQMEKKILRLLLISAAAMLALPLAFANSAYPKTASCPIEGGTAHATGKTRQAMQASCTDVEYKHKGTDYSDPRHPQKFNHVFWITHCTE